MAFRGNMIYTRSFLVDGRVIAQREYAEHTTFDDRNFFVPRYEGLPTSTDDPNGLKWPVCLSPHLKPWDAFMRVTKIQLGGSKSYKFLCSGINLIYVQGKKSSCISTCDVVKDQDRTKTLEYLLAYFPCLAEPKLFTPRLYKQPVELEPCAAVAALVDSVEGKGSMSRSGHKVSGEEAAMSFLRKELESHSTESLSGTLQVAIDALQSFYYMKKLEADEIEVCVCGVDGSSSLLTREEITGFLTPVL